MVASAQRQVRASSKYLPEGVIATAVIGGVMWRVFSSLEEWLKDRRERKEWVRQNEEFNKHHHFDDGRSIRVGNVDGAPLYEHGYGAPNPKDVQK